MAYSTPRTWVAEEYPTAAQMNANLRDNVAFLANPPACRVYNSGALAVANATDTLVTFDSERYDTDAMHSTTVNPSRIAFTTAGLYLVTFHGAFQANNAGTRSARIVRNAGNNIAYTSHAVRAGFQQGISLAAVWKFAAADYVEVYVVQDSGGALNLDRTADYSPEFSATWVGLG